MKGMIFMLCEKCGKNTATVLYTQIINGQKSTLNICSACASEESIFDNFGSLLSFGTREQTTNIVCPCCNMTLSEFARRGKAGCGMCYTTFRKHAGAMLRKIHGTQKHTQTEIKESLHKSEEITKEVNETDLLREKMAKAIAEENFEEAARLRDQIREKEGKKSE